MSIDLICLAIRLHITDRDLMYVYMSDQKWVTSNSDVLNRMNFFSQYLYNYNYIHTNLYDNSRVSNNDIHITFNDLIWKVTISRQIGFI